MKYYKELGLGASIVVAVFLFSFGGCGGNDATCASGLIDCEGQCIDPLTNRSFCGAVDNCEADNIGVACAAGQICDGTGSCALTCQDGLIDCDGQCIDPQTDRAFCGATDDCQGAKAGLACSAGEICDGDGTCALTCQDGLIDCGGTCTDPLTDRAFCGATTDCQDANVGVACESGEICDGAGSCQLTCQTGLVDCDDTCVDPLSDVEYCGVDATCGGGVVCGEGQSCDNGACGIATFAFTGAEQQFVVPAGFTSVTIEARGARGGAGFSSGTGFGRGGVVKAILSVTPGETLSIFVGGVGANGFTSGTSPGGFNGGGSSTTSGNLTSGAGGGASDVRQGGNALADRVLVAGGGGGQSQNGASERGGDGGASIGEAGDNGTIGANPGFGGTGGTQVAGGLGGTDGAGADGSAGELGLGGAAIGNGTGNSGAGGGGGFFGGGAGEASFGAGSPGSGGGGSSFVVDGAIVITNTQGGNSAAGSVTITW